MGKSSHYHPPAIEKPFSLYNTMGTMKKDGEIRLIGTLWKTHFAWLYPGPLRISLRVKAGNLKRTA